MKNKLSIVLRFAVSFGLLLLLLWIMRKDAKEVMGILKNSNKLIFLSAIGLNMLLSVVTSYRLKLLMRGQSVKVSIKDAVYLTFIGYFYNNFLPTAIGGDIAKAYYASKKTNNKIASYAAVLADRILGLVSTLLIALLGLLFIGRSMDNKLIVWAVLFVFTLTVAIIIILLKKNNHLQETVPEKKGIIYAIKTKALKLYTAINLYRNKPYLLMEGIGISLIFVLCIGGNMPLFRLFLIIPLVWAVSMLPSLNGLGVREGAFVYFLKGYIGAEKAFAVSLLWLGLIMLYSAIGGIFQLLYPIKLKGGNIND
jgi:glycosyltransferase 2 family protein